MNPIIAVLNTTLVQAPLYIILSIGLLVSFRALRFPDLTVEGSFLLGASVSALIAHFTHFPWLALILSTFAGAFAGFSTACLVAYLRISKLLAGIIVMTALYSLSYFVIGGASQVLTVDETVFRGWSRVTVFSESVVLWPVAGAVVVIIFFLLKSEFGIHLRGFGHRPNLLKAIGRNEILYSALALVIANGCVGLAGGLSAQTYGTADVNMGSGYLIAGLACLFLAEAILFPLSIATAVAGTLLGAIAYCLCITVTHTLNVPPPDFKAASAALLALAALLAFYRRRDRRSAWDISI